MRSPPPGSPRRTAPYLASLETMHLCALAIVLVLADERVVLKARHDLLDPLPGQTNMSADQSHVRPTHLHPTLVGCASMGLSGMPGVRVHALGSSSSLWNRPKR